MNIGTALHIGTFLPGSDEWHAARAQGLGGSEIAAVLGLSPFESKFSLFHRKAGDLGPIEITSFIEWGSRLEDAVVAKFLDSHPEFSREFEKATYCHQDRPWQIANPDVVLFRRRSDGDVELDSVGEVKTSPYGDNWGEHGTDDIPPHVRVQCIWYGDVLGVYKAHVAVLISGHDYREYSIEWDEAEATLIRDAGRRFLDDLAADARPEIDSSTHTYQALRELHPDIDPRTVEIPAEVAGDFIVTRAQLALAKDAEQAARSTLADHMGTAAAATWNGYTIARRQAKKTDGALPYIVAAKKLPDIQPEREKPAA